METSSVVRREPTAIEAGLHLLYRGLAFETRVVDARGRLIRILERTPVPSYHAGLALVDRFRLRHGGDRLPYSPALADRLARRPRAA